MSNTLSSSLVLDSISSTVVTPLGNLFAPLNAFFTDFSDETYTKGQNIRIRYATSGPTAQTNPTNWESGDSVQDNVNLQVNHYSASIQISPDEVEKKFRLEMLAGQLYQSFANKIMDVAWTPLTTTNFSNITQAQSGLVYQNLQTVWAAIAKSPFKNLVLDATSLSVLMPKDRFQFDIGGALTGQGQPGYGYDAIYLNTRWNGAGTNVYGFAGGRNALGFVAGLPLMEDETKEDINTTTIEVPLSGNGTNQQGVPTSRLSVYASTWISRATRIRWASLDVMFGAAKLDNSASRIFLSA